MRLILTALENGSFTAPNVGGRASADLVVGGITIPRAGTVFVGVGFVAAGAAGTKASCEVVNPAYTSQTCPNCGFVSRKNRCGIKFQCCYCGKISHADVVGGSGLLRRSEDKQIGLADYPAVVKPILEARHEEWKKFQASLSVLGRKKNALEPSSRKLTTEVPGSSRDRHSFELEPVGGGR